MKTIFNKLFVGKYFKRSVLSILCGIGVAEEEHPDMPFQLCWVIESA